MAAVRIAPMGLATFFPAKGGAEPWTGSNMEVLPGWMLPLAAMPRPPWRPAARSVMMSPNMLLVTITSKGRGSRTRAAQRASTYMCSGLIWGYSAADGFEAALPEASGVGHGVGFVAHEDAGARRAVGFGVAQAVFEGIADDAAHALGGVDVFLDGDFGVSSLPGDAAFIHVNAFGVFADDYEVEIFRLDVFQRAERGV